MKLRMVYTTVCALLVAATGTVIAPTPAQADIQLLVSGVERNIHRYDGNTGAFIDLIASGNPVTGIAIGADGLLYVGSGNTPVINRYDPIARMFVDTFAVVGVTNDFQDRPEGIAFGPDGHLYVTVPNPNGTVSGILRFDGGTGNFIDTFVPVSGIRNFVFGPDGNIYALSGFDVKKYDGVTGAFIEVFTKNAGLSTSAEGITFGPDGNLYVANWNPARIHRYDGTTGNFLNLFVSSMSLPSGIAFGPDGNFYAAGRIAGDVSRYDGVTGTFIDAFVTAGSGSLRAPTFLLFFDDNPVPVALNVDIDIKPGSFPNSINLCSGGATPVAVLGSDDLDVNDIDIDTLALGTAGIKTVGKTDKVLCSVKDVSGDFTYPEGDPDGIDDLVCHFVTVQIAPEEGDTMATLAGSLIADAGGTAIEGSDSVNIVKDCP
jgi:sugar lactone lactonase YvrE